MKKRRSENDSLNSRRFGIYYYSFFFSGPDNSQHKTKQRAVKSSDMFRTQRVFTSHVMRMSDDFRAVCFVLC